MAVPGRDNSDQSALAMFAAELRAVRAKTGLSRNDLADQLNYSGSLVGMIESMARVPSLEFAQRADTALGTPGTFARMQLHLRAAPFPSWFRPSPSTSRTPPPCVPSSIRWCPACCRCRNTPVPC
jgi:transcriptional regulator with XRE-family HTH domain